MNAKMVPTVGYPATLSYFSYFPFWQTFFEALGCKFVSSPVSSREIVDWGVKETVNDACIPIKLFHGHVVALRDKVDFLLVPRMISVDGKATFCPKFLGLPDMLRASVADLPHLIDQPIELKKGARGLLAACCSIGRVMKKSRLQSTSAFWKALLAHRRFQEQLAAGMLPAEIFAGTAQGQAAETSHELTLAVLGYPYEVHDPYISVNILEKLRSMHAQAKTMEMVPLGVLSRYRNRLPKNLFWHYSNRVMWATYYYLEQKVDGIIHVSAFGCGPDAMLDKLMELEAKAVDMPFITLTIDELTGEAGVVTRLEAFVDMVRYRRERQ